MPHARPHHTAVVIGRLQIFHRGHATLLRQALEQAEQVIIVLGSSFAARSSKNPFTWEERANMVRATLTAQQQARVAFVPVRDYADLPRWAAAVQRGVVSHGPQPQRTVLVGFRKDATSDYLNHFPQWQLHLVQQEVDIDATNLRRVLFEGGDADIALAALEPLLHPGALAYLRAWCMLPAYERMVRESRAVAASRSKYGAGPHLTADAVVRVGDHVLLVRRGGEVGHGLWAVPGGFVELHEPTVAAALRELQEETAFPWSTDTLLRGRQADALFQDPGRSARGRVISHAFYFRFGDMPLPKVKAHDDAQEARWFHVSDLPGLADRLFEDHALILERFVGGVLPD